MTSGHALDIRSRVIVSVKVNLSYGRYAMSLSWTNTVALTLKGNLFSPSEGPNNLGMIY
jgi:hypothetical protein